MEKNNVIKYFTQDELNSIFKVIKNSNEKYSSRNLILFKLAYWCALRSSEVGLLTVDDFNPVKNEIYCKRLKGSFNNTLKLDKDTSNLLKKYIKEATSLDPTFYILFKSRENNPISRQMLDRLIKKYCIIAKIKDTSKYHFHTFKHSRAVNLAESGLDIKEVQYWLGHKEVNNTMVYFQFTTSQQSELYRKLGLLY